MAAVYPDQSLFTVAFDSPTGEAAPISGGEARSPRDPSFDLAVIEFDDDGRFESHAQLGVAAEWITTTRRNPDFKDNGVVVVVFVHGWHHGAQWHDDHLIAFRRVLRALAVREMERAVSRRVIGVFVAWHGDPPGYWFRDTIGLTHLSFYNRYQVAEKISKGDDLYQTLRTITLRAKQSPEGLISGQLVLVGHSMGGLIIEAALRRMIEGRDLLQAGQSAGLSPVTTHINGQPVVFPDAVLSLNSAADSRICRAIGDLLSTNHVCKSASSPTASYSPPLLISATSTADRATGVAWRVTHPLRRTTGHDRSLLTHDFLAEVGTVEARPFPGAPDFGQNFHVLRPPDPAKSNTPRMRVDLPVRDRTGINDRPPHRRYRLEPKGQVDQPRRIWNFQLPPELVKDHNDIFNSRASSLLLALMQISGTVGSLAPDWERSFEPY
jgi:pimeloyl-ACP methyl ester carboxylesterase